MERERALDLRPQYTTYGWTINWWGFLSALIMLGSSLFSITVFRLLLF
jgi:hypothetical protein